MHEWGFIIVFVLHTNKNIIIITSKDKTRVQLKLHTALLITSYPIINIHSRHNNYYISCLFVWELVRVEGVWI